VVSRLVQYDVLKFAWRKDRQSSQSRTSEEVPARRRVAKRGEFCRQSFLDDDNENPAFQRAALGSKFGTIC
jgi:hypothetical protein